MCMYAYVVHCMYNIDLLEYAAQLVLMDDQLSQVQSAHMLQDGTSTGDCDCMKDLDKVLTRCEDRVL